MSGSQYLLTTPGSMETELHSNVVTVLHSVGTAGLAYYKGEQHIKPFL